MLYIHNNKLLVMASLLFLITIMVPLTVAVLQERAQTQSSAQNKAQETLLTFTVYFHGIGESGDSLSPSNTKQSTKEPIKNKKDITITIYNSSNKLVLTKGGSVAFNHDRGAFIGTVPIGNTLQAGSYIIKVHSQSYLWRRVGGTINIIPRADNKVPAISMVAGDFNNNNTLDTLDYNILMGCYSDLLDPSFCDVKLQERTDLSNDFKVNFLDYNLFLREIAVVQHGD